MEGDSSYTDVLDVKVKRTRLFLKNLEQTEIATNQEERLITIDILPDEMHDRILSCLPLVAIFQASCVCKKWNHIIHSKKFFPNDAALWSEKTWYFMFSKSVKSLGYLYDSGMRKWYNYKLPFMAKLKAPTWDVAPSHGLVCFMNDHCNKEMYICNPITRDYKVIENPPYLQDECGPDYPQYSALAFSVDQSKSKYTISIVRSMQASYEFFLWNFYIHMYNSNDKIWLPPVMGATKGFRPDDVSVICDNILYILVSSSSYEEANVLHGVITYNLDNTEPSIGVLKDESVILVPCALTCGRLMNVKKKLVLVGGTGRPRIIKDVGIWVLDGRVWTEISRMPGSYVRSLGKLDRVFVSTGGGDLIYIQSCDGTALVVFDMDTRQWFWSHKCPMSKKFQCETFSGFCFEPALLSFV